MAKVVRHLWLVIMSCCLLLAGCAPEHRPELLDALSETQPICWWDICPGSTEPVKARDMLAEREDITIISEDPEHSILPSVSWAPRDSSTGNTACGGILYHNRQSVVLVTLETDGHVHLGDIIERFGVPPEVVAARRGAEQVWLYVYLRYPQQGLLVIHLDRHWQRSSETVALQPDMPVTAIDLFAAGSPELWGPLVVGETGGVPYQPWAGWDTPIPVVH